MNYKTVMLAALLAVACGWANGADIPVTDENSLQNAFTSGTAGDTVVLSTGGTDLTLSGTITGTVDNLALDGAGESITGNGTFALFDLVDDPSNPTLYHLDSITNLTLTGGYASDANKAGAVTVHTLGGISNSVIRNNESTHSISAGAIYVHSDFTGSIVNNVIFEGNLSQGSGGGLFVGGDFLGTMDGSAGQIRFEQNQSANDGGGIFIMGDFGIAGGASLVNTVFQSNTADWASGGGLYVGNDFFGNIASDVLFDDNTAGGGHGGALFVGQHFTGNIDGALFTGNTAGRSGGAIWAEGMNGNVNQGTVFSGNTATEHGGAFFMAGLSVGTGAAMIGDISAEFTGNRADQTGGAIRIGAQSQASMTGSILSSRFDGNSAGMDGGAIYFYGMLNGDIRDSVFTGNTTDTGDGGAVFFNRTMDGTIKNVLFSENGAGGDGGALYFTWAYDRDMDTVTFTGNTAGGHGGALYFADAYTGSFTNVSFTGNEAGGNGGAVFFNTAHAVDVRDIAYKQNTAGLNGGALFFNDDFTGGIMNALFDGNGADADGGAVYFSNAFANDIADTGFVNNSAGGNGGALFFNNDFTGRLSGTVFTGNSADGSGGAIYFTNGYANDIMNIAYTGNRAGVDGGALFFSDDFSGALASARFEGNSAGGNGGAVHFTNAYANNITNVAFVDNASGGDGGALYFNSGFSGRLTGTVFTGNGAGSRGGAVYFGGTYANSIENMALTGNTAGVAGGALFFASDFSGDLANILFEENRSDGDGGAVAVAGLYSGEIRNASLLGNTAVGDGGALYFGDAFSGSLRNLAVSGNQAGNDGGAAYISAGFDADVSKVDMTGNSAAGDGGALFIAGGFTGAIRDSSFTGNSAGGDGGALYFDTSAGGSYDLVFAASSGGAVMFDGNNSASGTNSFYVSGNSAADFAMRIEGQGTVGFYDPFAVAMDNGHLFSLTHDTPAATLIMSGRNHIQADGGAATISLLSGVTQVMSRSDITDDFSMIFHGDSTVDITFGSDHILSIMNMPNRDTNTALFNLNDVTGGNSFTVQDGSTLDVTRILKPLENNSYLLVDGLDPNSDSVILGEFVYLHPSGYTKAPVLRNGNTEIWLDDIDLPDAFDPSAVTPNVVNGEACLTMWLNGTPAGLSLTAEQVMAVRNDFHSAVPEAAASLAVVGFDVHEMAARSANRSAFGLGAGGWGGFDLAASATANPQAGAGSIIAEYRTVSSQAGGVSSGGAYARLEPYRQQGFRMWTGYMGAFDRTRAYDGYSGYNVDTHGFLTGLVYDASDFVSVGAYGGYSRSDVEFRDLNADAKTNTGHFGLHASVKTVAGLRAVLDASYSHADHKLKRYPAGLGTTRGSVKQDILGAGLSLAYEVYLTPTTRLTPLGRVNAAWLWQDSLNESGAYLASHVRKMRESSVHTLLGASLAHDFMLSPQAVFTPSLGAGWKHLYGGRDLSTTYYFLDNAAVSGTTPSGCTIRSRERARDSALISAAMEGLFTTSGGRQWGVKAAYNLETARKRTSHALFAGAEIRF